MIVICFVDYLSFSHSAEYLIQHTAVLFESLLMGLLQPVKCAKPDCGEDVPASARHCVVCGFDMGTPNVRAANRPEEIEALQARLETIRQTADTVGYRDVLEGFQQVVADSSVAILCRPIGGFMDLVSSDNKLYNTFYQSVESEGRIPEDNEWDSVRLSVDSMLFPYYAKEIRFAALSINGKGVTGYGDFSASLKESAIQDRSSVFEENTIQFVQKNEIVPGKQIPLGFRASWNNRGKLAAAKLGIRLTSTTLPEEYPNILVSGNSKEADFIEVNIYGAIHRRAISRFSGMRPRLKADQILLKQIIKKLQEINAVVEIT